MIEKINKPRKGEVTVLNNPEHIKAILELNIELQKIRIDFRFKSYLSEASAPDSFFTT